jgi:hypothetical protein
MQVFVRSDSAHLLDSTKMALDQELPSYMYAADVHNIANGAPSVVEGASSTFDALTKGTVSVIARGITSAFNTVPAASNWMGLTDIPEWQTEDLLRSFDNDLAAYYSEHRDTVDVVGDIAASFVPGMAAVKGLNYAQKGLAGLNRGSAGTNLLRSFGTLPTAADDVAKKAAERMGGNTFNMIDSQVLKAFGTNYAQNALEFAVFETAAASTMGEFSPLFENHTAKDIIANAAIGGGVVGAGILGTVSAVQTYGAVKRARNAVDVALSPFRRITDAPEGVDDWVRILEMKNQNASPPKVLSEMTDAERRAWETASRSRNLTIQETLTKMAGGDAEVGATLGKTLEAMDPDQAWAALLKLQNIARPGASSSLENKLAAALENKRLYQDTEYLKTLSAKQVIALKEKADVADEIAVKYLHLRGPDAGKVMHSAPNVTSLADDFAKADITREVGKIVGKQAAMGGVWSPAGKSAREAEARYVAAFQKQYRDGMLIHSEDLPHLEAALLSKDVEKISVSGIEMDKMQLAAHIKTMKEELALKMIDDAAIDPLANTDTIAKSLNVNRNLLEGSGRKITDDSDYFAAKTLDDLLQPTVVKLAYDANQRTAGVSGDVLSGMVKMKEAQLIQQRTNANAVASVLGLEKLGKLPAITDRHVLSATSGGAGAGFANFASGEYGTLASIVEWLGKLTNTWNLEARTALNETLTPWMLGVIKNPQAGNEIAALRQRVLMTGEHYIFTGEEAVLKSVRAYEVQLAKGVKNPAAPVIPPELKGFEKIKLETQEARDFMQMWVKTNDAHLEKAAKIDHAMGKVGKNYGGVIHFPQPSSKQFPFFSLVVPKNKMAGEQTQMLWASSADDLANLESKVPAEYAILRKSDTEEYYKALKEYDYDLGFHGTELRHELQRKGVAAPFFPKSDPNQLMQEMLEWRYRLSDKLNRDAISLNYQTQFSELRRLDSNYKALQTSSKQKQNVDSPFESYVKTALDIPRSSHVPVWTEINNLAENVFSSAYNKVVDAVRGLKGEEALQETNRIFDKNGIRGFKDAMTQAFANHPAGGKELSKFVMNMNGALSFLMLRSDPMNALNNGIGHSILTGSELKYVLKLIRGAGKNAEAELLQAAYVGLPGASKQVLSPTKLVSDAYGDWAKVLQKDPQALSYLKQYEKNGWLPSLMDQQRSIMESATLTGVESASALAAKSHSALTAFKELAEKVTLNKSVEEMNRFTAARIAHRISDIAVKHGKMTTQEQDAFINTFVNRTQGNYLASQRPLLFQGPVGHAISLFQTYSFNFLQHIFRHVEQGDKKQLATLMGLQTAVYGLNGLPAFNFMNNHLVGMAAGNTSHQDVYGFVKDNGGDVGNWLLYGGLSNATGLGIYSRGDLNPRNATLVAGSVSEIPFVSATRNFFGSLANAAGEATSGANPASTILRGIEHAGISRPLAGLATTLQGLTNEDELGYTTSGKNQLMSSWDMYSLSSAVRIAGARPFDEAVARDAYHRVQVYDAHRQAQIASVGSSIRDKVRSRSEVTEEEFDNFLTSYVHKGGNQKDFIKYWQKQVKDADKGQIDALVGNAKRPFSQYMQQMMEGPLTQEID